MLSSPDIKKAIGKMGAESIVTTTSILARSAFIRKASINAMRKYVSIHRNNMEHFIPRPIGVVEDRQEFSNVIWATADRILASNYARPVNRSIVNNLISGIMAENGSEKAISAFQKEFGSYPPGFLTLSPGKTCNLRCTGCYANAGPDSEKLDWYTFDRIITEAEELWGVRFMVISGGEPLAYRSEGKGLLDVAKNHPNVFFLMYTNGLLITEEVAQQLAEVGNITPAISVEGWRERTDERRGSGVFDKILESMARLRQAGVPFGISLTATRHNVEEIFSDEFLDFFFNEQNALYGWLFHYMPIGRSYTLDLMPTPEQRIWMLHRIWEVIRKRHIFLADFWNHGTLSDGCIAAGGNNGGGYFYIDWNGTVSPCVFAPYAPLDIREVYAHGGTLNDVWSNAFFGGIRDWQKKYKKKNGNWLAPCIIRDHHQEFRELVARYEPKPIDDNARKALLDTAYAQGMKEYDEAYQALSDPIWQKQYLQTGKILHESEQWPTENNGI